MRKVVLLLLLLLTILNVRAGQLPLTPSQGDAAGRLAKSYGQLPLSFEANQGQSDKAVKFISRGQGYTLFLTPGEAVLALRKAGPKAGAVALAGDNPCRRDAFCKPLAALKPSPKGEGKQGKNLFKSPHPNPFDAAQGGLLPVGEGERSAAPSTEEEGTKPETLALRMKLVGANPEPAVAGLDELPGKVNYLKGNDPAQWKKGIATYGKVRYQGVYPGIDVVYYGKQRQLEYDFIVQPGADPGDIRLDFGGADGARIDAAGDLLLDTPGGELRLQKPVVYQTVDGKRQNLDGRFVLHDANQGGNGRQIGFQVAAYDVAQPLVIDPVLVYSTYLGGSSLDSGYGIAVDSVGNAYVAGVTTSRNFPTVTPALQDTPGSGATGGDLDIFVSKFNPSGTALTYSTFLGGSGNDTNASIAVDSAGDAYVMGETDSVDFPTANPLFPNLMGAHDAVIAKIDSSGSSLIYSTYLGGSGDEIDGTVGVGQRIAADSVGNAYVVGITTSGDYPTTAESFRPTQSGGGAYITKLNSSGSALIYSTYLGQAYAKGIAIDSLGNAYVTGYTSSLDFPTQNALQPNLAGNTNPCCPIITDAFITKINAVGSDLIYSTYLGGSSADIGTAISVDGNGNAYVTGSGGSSDFPTTAGAFNPTGQGIFVTKLNSSGNALLYSTFLGSSNTSTGNSITVDNFGNAYVTGYVTSGYGSPPDFPLVNPIPNSWSGVHIGFAANDAFVTKINPSGSDLVYSSLLGGNRYTSGYGIAVDSNGNAYVTGYTNSESGFPLVNALQPVYGGSSGQVNSDDAFVAKISDTTPPPTATFGGFTLTSPSGSAAEPVNTATGNYYYQHTDLSIAGRGLLFAFARTYNAQDSYSGPLGRGWTHSYNLRLTENSDGSVTIKQGDGHEEFYDLSGSGYASRYPGLYSALLKNADNSYTVTAKDRTVYAFDSAGKLTKITGKFGKALSFAYDGAGDLSTVTDMAGQTVAFSYDADHRITRITDPLGRQVLFAYDADGHLISDTDPLGQAQTYSYDASHRLTQIVNRRGQVLIGNTYDDSNRVVAQVNGRGFATTFAYDAPNAGDTTIADPLGHATIHSHDDLRRLVKETDPLGHTIQYVYDANNNRTSVTDRNGNVTQYAYDARGNVTSQTDALGHITTIAYDSLDNPAQRTDALGGVSQWTYDGSGRPIQRTDALGQVSGMSYKNLGQKFTDALGRVSATAYDAQGNPRFARDTLGGKASYEFNAVGRMTALTDANGAATAFVYDGNDRVTQVTDPLGNATQFGYDANGNLTGVTDALGRHTGTVYNENDLPVSVADALGGATAYSYDAADNLVSTTDTRGNVTQYAYDAAKRLISVTDALGQTTALGYDAQGNIVSQTNALGHAVQFGYDALNRRVSATDSLGHVTQTAYDALGRTTQSTDANGRATHFVYDAVGRLTQTTDAGGGAATYSYDAVGNRIAVTGPNGNATTYAYDALNRLTAETDPLGQAHQYAYDAVGNVIQRTDALSQATGYSYDAARRLTAIQYPDATSVSFQYDALGNRTAMTDGVGQSLFSYDALNRLTQHTDPFGNAVSYAYDAAGNRTALVYPGNKSVAYGYDALNRMQSVTDWLGNTATYGYDAAGNLIAANNPNGTQAAYTYDNAERLTQLLNSKPDASVLASYNLTLDAAGNRVAVDNSQPLAELLTDNNITYTYDAAGQLATRHDKPISHDGNGNIVGHENYTYSYDYENRLTATPAATYRYDGLGRRVETERGLAATRYVLDLGQPLSQVLMETDAAGQPLAYYVYGLGLLSRVEADGSTRYYHYDPTGNTVALSAADGSVSDSYAYDAFGVPTNVQQTASNPFRFAGQFGVMDEGGGLNFVRARYYVPKLGRFTSKDPLHGGSFDPQTLNRYAYALNNPIRFVDISGLSASEGSASSETNQASDQDHNYLLPGNRTKLTEQEKRILQAQVEAFQAESAFHAAEIEMYSMAIGEVKIIQGMSLKTAQYLTLGLIFSSKPLTPDDMPRVVGRKDSIVPPGGGVSNFIEQHVVGGREFGEAHDAVVENLTKQGYSDARANIPTMLGVLEIEVLKANYDKLKKVWTTSAMTW